jgi:SpoVK/Ycf46/Vps4 family AAA+-type ATPase
MISPSKSSRAKTSDLSLAAFVYDGVNQYVLMSPLELTARELLPNDAVVVVTARPQETVLGHGRVWPHGKLDKAAVRLPCCLIAGAPGGGAPAAVTVKVQAGEGLSVDVVPASAYSGPRLAPCHALHVLAGGPSLELIRSHIMGAAVPAAGGSIALGSLSVHLLPVGLEDGVEYGLVGPATRLVRGPPPSSPTHDLDTAGTPLPFSIGGLGPQIAELQALVRASQAAAAGGCGTGRLLRPARGAILVGPPGTGKTLLAQSLASSLALPFRVVQGPEIVSPVVGQSEAALRRAFAEAAGGLLFIDEVDSVAPSRAGGGGEVETRLVATLLTLMDRLALSGDAPGPTFVLAATNRVTAVDAALRRPGRFDREIDVPVPSQAARADILRACLRRYPHGLGEADIAAVADGLHGFVGADIAAVCKEAALLALRRELQRAGAAEGDDVAAALSQLLLEPRSPPPSPAITVDDVRAGARRVQPSAIREIAVEVPTVTWADVGGQEDVKAQLQEAVEWPLLHAAAFTALGIRPPHGVLLYGPPGCSKTMMARAMASTGRMNFVAVKGPELLSKYVGDSEKAVAEVFHRARAAAPCVVFFDEFDALAPRRGDGGEDGGAGVAVRVVSQLLTELDGISGLRQVVVVAATNRPDLIDPALLRPGRLDRLLYVGLPDAPARLAIVKARISRVPHDPALHAYTFGGDCLDSLCADGGALAGYSGAELVAVVQEASRRALQEYVDARGDGWMDPDGRGSPPSASPGGGEGRAGAAEGAGPRLTAGHLAFGATRVPKAVGAPMLAFYKRWALG